MEISPRWQMDGRHLGHFYSDTKRFFLYNTHRVFRLPDIVRSFDELLEKLPQSRQLLVRLDVGIILITGPGYEKVRGDAFLQFAYLKERRGRGG